MGLNPDVENPIPIPGLARRAFEDLRNKESTPEEREIARAMLSVAQLMSDRDNYEKTFTEEMAGIGSRFKENVEILPVTFARYFDFFEFGWGEEEYWKQRDELNALMLHPKRRMSPSLENRSILDSGALKDYRFLGYYLTETALNQTPQLAGLLLAPVTGGASAFSLFAAIGASRVLADEFNASMDRAMSDGVVTWSEASKARIIATASAGVTYALEKAGVETMLGKKIVSSKILGESLYRMDRDILGRFVLGFAGEGLTEATESLSSSLIAAFVEQDPEILNGFVESALNEGFFGALFGGGVSIAAVPTVRAALAMTESKLKKRRIELAKRAAGHPELGVLAIGIKGVADSASDQVIESAIEELNRKREEAISEPRVEEVGETEEEQVAAKEEKALEEAKALNDVLHIDFIIGQLESALDERKGARRGAEIDPEVVHVDIGGGGPVNAAAFLEQVDMVLANRNLPEVVRKAVEKEKRKAETESIKRIEQEKDEEKREEVEEWISQLTDDELDWLSGQIDAIISEERAEIEEEVAGFHQFLLDNQYEEAALLKFVSENYPYVNISDINVRSPGAVEQIEQRIRDIAPIKRARQRVALREIEKKREKEVEEAGIIEEAREPREQVIARTVGYVINHPIYGRSKIARDADGNLMVDAEDGSAVVETEGGVRVKMRFITLEESKARVRQMFKDGGESRANAIASYKQVLIEQGKKDEADSLDEMSEEKLEEMFMEGDLHAPGTFTPTPGGDVVGVFEYVAERVQPTMTDKRRGEDLITEEFVHFAETTGLLTKAEADLLYESAGMEGDRSEVIAHRAITLLKEIREKRIVPADATTTYRIARKLAEIWEWMIHIVNQSTETTERGISEKLLSGEIAARKIPGEAAAAAPVTKFRVAPTEAAEGIEAYLEDDMPESIRKSMIEFTFSTVQDAKQAFLMAAHHDLEAGGHSGELKSYVMDLLAGKPAPKNSSIKVYEDRMKARLLIEELDNAVATDEVLYRGDSPVRAGVDKTQVEPGDVVEVLHGPLITGLTTDKKVAYKFMKGTELSRYKKRHGIIWKILPGAKVIPLKVGVFDEKERLALGKFKVVSKKRNKTHWLIEVEHVPAQVPTEAAAPAVSPRVESVADQEKAEKIRAAKLKKRREERKRAAKKEHETARLPLPDEPVLVMGPVEKTLHKLFRRTDSPTSEQLARMEGAPKKKGLDRWMKATSYENLRSMMKWALEQGVEANWYRKFGLGAEKMVGGSNINEFAVIFGITSAQKAAETNLAETLHIMAVARKYHPVKQRREFIKELKEGTRPYREVPEPKKGRQPKSNAPMLGIGGDEIIAIADFYKNKRHKGGLKVTTYMQQIIDKVKNVYNPFTVQDVHMSRAFGFLRKKKKNIGTKENPVYKLKLMAGKPVDGAKFNTEKEIRYAMFLTTRLAEEFNVTTDEAQAMVWFYAKTNLSPKSERDIEGLPGTWDSAVEWSQTEIDVINQMKQDGSLNTNEPLIPGLDEAPRPEFTKKTKVVDKYSNVIFFDELTQIAIDRSGRIVVSTNPGLARGYGFENVTFEDLVEYNDKILARITDEEGQIRLLRAMGIPHSIAKVTGTYDRKEPSFVISLPGETFETASLMASVLGDALLQDSAITAQPDYDGQAWTAVVRKDDGTKWTQDELDVVYTAVNPKRETEGLNFTSTRDEKGLEFLDTLYFKENREYTLQDIEAFADKLASILGTTGIKTSLAVAGKKSELTEHAEYRDKIQAVSKRTGVRHAERRSILQARANDLLYKPVFEEYHNFRRDKGLPENATPAPSAIPAPAPIPAGAVAGKVSIPRIEPIGTTEVTDGDVIAQGSEEISSIFDDPRKAAKIRAEAEGGEPEISYDIQINSNNRQYISDLLEKLSNSMDEIEGFAVSGRGESTEALRSRIETLLRNYESQFNRGPYSVEGPWKEVQDVTDKAGMIDLIGRIKEGIRKSKEESSRKYLKETLKLLRKKETHRRQLLPEYAGVVTALLEGVNKDGDMALTDTKLNRIEKIVEYIRERPDVGISEQHRAQLEKLYEKTMGELEAWEAKSIADAINATLMWNETHRKLLGTKSQMALKGAVSGILSEFLRANIRSGIIDDLSEGKTGKLTKVSKGMINLAVGIEMNTSLGDLVQILAGGVETEAYQHLYDNVRIAQNAAYKGWFEFNDAFISYVEEAGITDEELSLMSETFSGHERQWWSLVPFVSKGETRAKVYEVNVNETDVVKMTESEVLGLYASLLDEGFYRNVTGRGVKIRVRGQARAKRKFGMTEDDVRAFRAYVVTNHYKGAALVGRSIDYLNKNLKEKMRNWSNVHEGYDITRDGVYYPTHRDTTASEVNTDKNSIEVLAYQSAPVAIENAGLAQEREEGAMQDYLIGDFFEEVSNAAWVTNSVVNLSPALKNAMKILDSEEMKVAFDESRRGPALRKRMKDTYRGIAAESLRTSPPRGIVDERFAHYKKNVTLALLQVNPRVAFYQPASLIVAATEFSERRFLYNAMRSDAWTDTEAVEKDIREFSPALRFRMEGPSHGVVSESVFGKMQEAAGKKNRRPEETMMQHIRMFDSAAIRVIWRAAEAQAQSEGKEGRVAKARAAQIAERVVRRTQPTFWSLDQSGLQVESRQNVIASLMSFFRAQRAKNNSTIYRRYWEYRRGEISRAQFSANAAEVYILQSFAVAAVKYVWKAGLTGLGIGLSALLGVEEEEERLEDDWDKTAFRKMREDDGLLKTALLDIQETAFSNFIGGSLPSYFIRTALSKERRMDPLTNPLAGMSSEIIRAASAIQVNVIDSLEAGEEIDMWDLIEDSVLGLTTYGGITKATPGLPLFRQFFQVTRPTKKAYEEDKKKGKKRSRRGSLDALRGGGFKRGTLEKLRSN